MPNCIKVVLGLSGFDTIFSLYKIDVGEISKIEKHVNAHRMHDIQELRCCHSEFYSARQQFKFLPGHVAILLALPKYAINFMISQDKLVLNDNHPFILNEMIKTANSNMYTDQNHASYSDVIRFFATYVFLLCGRSCYLMLRENLPFPSVKTIRKLQKIIVLKLCDCVS